MPESEIWFQPRMEWYLVRQTAFDLVEISKKIGLETQNVVFIGGMACSFHLQDTFGGKAAVSWRGTEDIDLAVFGLGGVQRLIKGIRDFSLAECSSQKSHLPNKWSCRIRSKRGQGFVPTEREWIDIDLYGQTSRKGILLNKRRLNPTRIIYDTPQLFKFGKSEIATPSLRDSLILKLDVLQYSDLRPKDEFDVLGCLAIAEKMQIPLQRIIGEIFDKISSRVLVQKTAKAMNNLKTTVESVEVPGGCFYPSREYLRNISYYLPE